MKTLPPSCLVLAFACALATSGQDKPPQQPIGSSGLYPDTRTQWVTAEEKPAANEMPAKPGSSIFHRTLRWDATENAWVPDNNGAWNQFISKGVRYQPTPLGLAGGMAGTPMGDLYYVGTPTDGHLYPNLYYEPIWKRDLGATGYIRQLGANNLAVYNVFNTPSFTVESLEADPDAFFVQPASGLIPTSTLLENSLTPGRSGTAPVDNAQTLPVRPVTGSSAERAHPWAMDFKPYGPLRYQNTAPGSAWAPNPGYFPEGLYVKNAQGVDTGVLVKQAPPHYYHFNHDRFLDICWNGGYLEPTQADPSGSFVRQLDPVYVWLAVGVSNAAFPETGTKESTSPDYYPYWQDYYNNLASWMAQSYGNHPAVIGFIITNETNTGNDGSYEYYEFINTVHATLKKHAPDKLTMVSFQDDVGSLTTKIPDPTTSQQVYPFTIYEPDIYGWNLYTAPSGQTDIIVLFSGNNPDAPQAVDYRKPIIITEIGIPATMRYKNVHGADTGIGNEPYLPVPNGYYYNYDGTTLTRAIYSTSSVNPHGLVLGRENPAILELTAAEWQTLKENGSNDPTHGDLYASGLVVKLSDPPDGTFRYQFLEAVEPSPVWQSLDFSADLDDLVTLYDTITQNPSLADAAGAGTATILWTWLNALGTTLQVPDDGSKATGNKLLSGYMVFEYTDEWDKWTDATSDTATVELAAGVQDFSDKSITGWASPSLTTTPPASQPISLNTTWDEEWFGLMSVQPFNRSSTSAPIGQYGWLNKGPDRLTPRLAYYVVQQLFTGSVSPVQAPPVSETATPTLLAAAPGFIRNADLPDYFHHETFGTAFLAPHMTNKWAYFFDFLGWQFPLRISPDGDTHHMISYSHTLGSWIAAFPERWAYSFTDGLWLWIPGETNPASTEQLIHIHGNPDPWVTLAELLASRSG